MPCHSRRIHNLHQYRRCAWRKPTPISVLWIICGCRQNLLHWTWCKHCQKPRGPGALVVDAKKKPAPGGDVQQRVDDGVVVGHRGGARRRCPALSRAVWYACHDALVSDACCRSQRISPLRRINPFGLAQINRGKAARGEGIDDVTAEA